MKPLIIALGMVMSSGLLSAQPQRDSAKLYQKEEKLFITMNMPAMFDKVVSETVDQQLATTPALTNSKAEVTAFFNKYISWTAIKPDVAKIYLAYFTSDEIDTLIKFYETTAGKKMAANSTKITQEITALIQNKVQPHVSEWNQLVTDKTNGN